MIVYRQWRFGWRCPAPGPATIVHLQLRGNEPWPLPARPATTHPRQTRRTHAGSCCWCAELPTNVPMTVRLILAFAVTPLWGAGSSPRAT
jgi:hypothetical protein